MFRHHDLLGLADLVAGEAELEREAACLERQQAGLGADRELQDLLRRPGGDFLDIDAAFRASHQDRHADGAVEHHADVDLARDVGGFLHEHLRHLLAVGVGLLGDERILEHDLGDLAGVVARLDELLMPPKSGVEPLKLPLPRPPAWTSAGLQYRPVQLDLVERGRRNATTPEGNEERSTQRG